MNVLKRFNSLSFLVVTKLVSCKGLRGVLLSNVLKAEFFIQVIDLVDFEVEFLYASNLKFKWLYLKRFVRLYLLLISISKYILGILYIFFLSR